LHCESLSRWAHDEVVNPAHSPSQSLQKFFFFLKLARKSFELNDYCTSAAILQGLSAKEIYAQDKIWQNCSEYLKVRKYWILSNNEALLVMTPSRSDPSSQRFRLEMLMGHYQQLASSGVMYLCSIIPLVNYICEWPIFKNPHENSSQKMNLTNARRIYDWAIIILQGVDQHVIKLRTDMIKTAYARSLANGPLRSVSHLPYLSLSRRLSPLSCFEINEVVNQFYGFDTARVMMAIATDYDSIKVDEMINGGDYRVLISESNSKTRNSVKRDQDIAFIRRQTKPSTIEISTPRVSRTSNFDKASDRGIALMKLRQMDRNQSKDIHLRLFRGKVKTSQLTEEYEQFDEYVSLNDVFHALLNGQILRIVRELKKFPEPKFPSELIMVAILACQVLHF
jgi:hypothetical protein